MDSNNDCNRDIEFTISLNKTSSGDVVLVCKSNKTPHQTSMLWTETGNIAKGIRAAGVTFSRYYEKHLKDDFLKWVSGDECMSKAGV